MGKIKRDSFLELAKSSSGDEMMRDETRRGKLNVTDLYPNNQKEDVLKGEIKVGRLNTKVRLKLNYKTTYVNIYSESQDLFNNKENEEIPLEKPRMKIGKLDPRNLFDKDEQDSAPATDNVVIGKLNRRNIFESSEQTETEKQVIKVGKINTEEMFSD